MDSLFNVEDNREDVALSHLQFRCDETDIAAWGEPLLQSTLMLRNEIGDFHSGHGQLFQDKLVFTPEPDASGMELTPLVTSIKWKRLLPFQDLIDECAERFGFQIFGHQNGEEFFCNDLADLDMWLDYLQPLMIMTNFEADFELHEELGRGSNAIVYQASHIDSGEIFAVKKVQKDSLRQNQVATNAFLNEVVVLRQLDHPNCLKLHRIYEDNECIFLILDKIEGDDLLKSLTVKHKFSEPKAVNIMAQLLSAIQYLNDNNIVHRDIKLENIMYQAGNEQIFLADFGLAQQCGDAEEMTLRCGSPGYVAPEVFNHDSYGRKCDVFSAGVVLYILLSGRTPFSGKTFKEKLQNNLSCQMYFPDRHWAHISKDAIRLVLAMTNPNPFKRITVEEAMEHPWFQHDWEQMSPSLPITKDQIANQQAAVPHNSPGENCSATFVHRMLGSGSHLNEYRAKKVVLNKTGIVLKTINAQERRAMDKVRRAKNLLLAAHVEGELKKRAS